MKRALGRAWRRLVAAKSHEAILSYGERELNALGKQLTASSGIRVKSDAECAKPMKQARSDNRDRCDD
jgi:predicted secreted Zn-dependent protease